MCYFNTLGKQSTNINTWNDVGLYLVTRETEIYMCQYSGKHNQGMYGTVILLDGLVFVFLHFLSPNCESKTENAHAILFSSILQ